MTLAQHLLYIIYNQPAECHTLSNGCRDRYWIVRDVRFDIVCGRSLAIDEIGCRYRNTGLSWRDKRKLWKAYKWWCKYCYE